MEEDRILTIEQASQFLKLHIETIKQPIREEKIPSYKVGKRRLFDPDEWFRWFKKHKALDRPMQKAERSKPTNPK